MSKMVGSYPADTEFEDRVIKSVDSGDATHGWSITYDDGWSFFVPPSSPVTPAVGMVARQYGRGIGATVRGLFLDGVEVFYRTPEEDERYGKESLYGKDVTEWLARWDRGESVWSVEMGGFGPGYEQAIQILAAEIVRDHLTDVLPDKGNRSYWDKFGEAAVTRTDDAAGGFSGAQVGAAKNIAAILLRRGPVAAFTDDAVKDRLIQVSRRFPVYDRPEPR